MNLIGSVVIAFSMYSKIPMPRVEWTKERMRCAMCFFPAVGLVICLVFCGLSLLYDRISGNGELFFVMLGTVTPLLITGGIHMDGFLDVTDARSSYGTRKKKLEILKDPHTGAFAIIGFGVYMLLYAGAFSVLSGSDILIFSGTFVLTRALSGLSVVTFPMAKEDGLAATFSGMSMKRTVIASMVVYIILSGVYLVLAGGIPGVAVLLGAVITFYWYYKMAVREFGGITGDLAGYFLQICELVILLIICFFRLVLVG